MRAFRNVAAALVLLAIPMSLMLVSQGFARVDPSAEIPGAASAQLIVMEADGCVYCPIFRRDVLPVYQASEHAKGMPVRFVDINDVEKSGLVLDGPISIVPTFVITKNNQEVGRIPGYLGPADFFQAIKYLVSSAS